jgi:hypothetical protein
VPEDGLQFDVERIRGERIIEAANYSGVRVRFTAHLGTARVPVQIDVGFGDPLIPGPSPVQMPTILDLPAPELLGYSRESTIAEKVQAMIYLGEMNSRMKDFYDVWSLATRFDFDGPTLAQAIRETCRWRQTPLSSNLVAFGDRFTRDEERQAQWRAFIRRLLLEDAPNTLHEAVKTIAAFIQPTIQALVEIRHFDQRWPPGGPWMEYVG